MDFSEIPYNSKKKLEPNIVTIIINDDDANKCIGGLWFEFHNHI